MENLKTIIEQETKTCPAVAAALHQAQVELAIEQLITVFPEEKFTAEYLLRYVVESFNLYFDTNFTLIEREKMIALEGIKHYASLLNNNEKG